LRDYLRNKRTTSIGSWYHPRGDSPNFSAMTEPSGKRTGRKGKSNENNPTFRLGNGKTRCEKKAVLAVDQKRGSGDETEDARGGVRIKRKKSATNLFGRDCGGMRISCQRIIKSFGGFFGHEGETVEKGSHEWEKVQEQSRKGEGGELCEGATKRWLGIHKTLGDLLFNEGKTRPGKLWALGLDKKWVVKAFRRGGIKKGKKAMAVGPVNHPILRKKS